MKQARQLLVTGGAGFIGSHYVRHLLTSDPTVAVINLDALKYSGNLANLSDLADHPRYRFVEIDLADRPRLERFFQEEKIDQIVHFAAESHVDRSLQQADPFLQSNILGTYHLLEMMRRFPIQKMIQISTDEVYGTILQGRATEERNLAPSNPYAATKASADLLALSYIHTFGLPILITRCTNNYGPYQHPEKFIPCQIVRLLEGKPISIYGDGQQERDWIHVTDHCLGIERVRERGKIGHIYHIGAQHPITNMEIAQFLLQLLNFPSSFLQHCADRPGHDLRYSLDTRKISQELDWHPTISLEEGIEETVQWYRTNPEWLQTIKR
jgi:dTDP-glucose 4,6-dehydratase